MSICQPLCGRDTDGFGVVGQPVDVDEIGSNQVFIVDIMFEPCSSQMRQKAAKTSHAAGMHFVESRSDAPTASRAIGQPLLMDRTP